MTGCDACGRQWPGTMRFCGACGAELPRGAEQTAAAENELRQATVLFADLVGFTTFSEGRTADEVGAVVADVLPRLVAVLRRFGGTTEKYLGDAVLSTFGLREADPRAGRSAVRAALELQRTMGTYREETGRDLHLRVGVHSGEVMVRRIGEEWAVLGDTVNTAARLQEVAEPDSVWISRALYLEVGRYVEALPRPTLPLKGKSLPMQPYEVRRERDDAGALAMPFSGRDREFGLLTAELDRALEEQTMRVVVVRGPAGVGKTRLVTELQDRLEDDDRLFRFDRVEYDRGDRAAAAGLGSLLKHRFHVDLDADAAQTLAALEAAAPAELGPDHDERQLDFLAFVLGVRREGARIAALDAEAVWTGVNVAVHTWVQLRARTHPWVVTLEDAHFGDPETAAYLDHALSVGTDAPVLVVMTVREEDFLPGSEWYERISRWVAEDRATEIVLHELPVEELTDALLALPEHYLTRATARRVAEHAEGHPLFALELVDYLATEGALVDQRLVSMTVLPSSVREAMEARIERLGREGKQLAKRGAFLGRRFTRDLVARLWDGDDASLDRAFEALRRSRTVFEEPVHGMEGRTEAVFRHGRLQEAALARVPREERLRWHRRLEEWARGRLEESPDEVDRVGTDVIPLIARSRAAHDDAPGAADWFEALGLLHRRQHRSNEAAQAFLAAADRTQGTRRQLLRTRAAAAVAAWGDLGRALSILETGEEDQAVGGPAPAALLALDVEPLDRWWELRGDEAGVSRRLQRADLLSRSGRVQEAAQEFAALGDVLLGMRGETARRLHLAWGRDYVHFLAEVVGDVDTAQGVLQRSRAMCPADEPEPHELLVMEDSIAMRCGDMVRAAETATARLERAERLGDLAEQSVAWNALGIVRTALGNLPGAEEAYDRSLQLAREIGDLRGEAITLHNLGILHLDRGEWAIARAHNEDYLRLSTRIGNWMAEAYAPIYLGLSAAGDGDATTAAKLLREGWDAADRHGWPRLSALAQAMRGELLVLSGVLTGDRDLVAAGTQAILDHEEGWRGLDDVGELYAVAAAGSRLSGDVAAAEAAVGRMTAHVHPSWVLANVWRDAAEQLASGSGAVAASDWLREHQFLRAAGLLDLLGRAVLARPGSSHEAAT